MKVKETCRLLAVSFSSGFLFGVALDATLSKTWNIDMRIGILWGAVFLLVFWLQDYAKWVIGQKTKFRKEEAANIIKDLDREISSLKNNTINLISSGEEGNIVLAGIYIDRVIELEKMKERLKSNSVSKRCMDDWTISNKLQK